VLAGAWARVLAGSGTHAFAGSGTHAFAGSWKPTLAADRTHARAVPALALRTRRPSEMCG